MTQPERLDSFELPAPTAWPMVVALGVTLGFTGLVTHMAVSVVGVVLFSVALASGAQDPAAARALIDFLAGPRATAVYQAKGFGG